MTENRDGWYEKYSIRRTDGTDEPGCKHENCQLFVIDLTHDPFAPYAMEEYARACEGDMPLLARDIRAKIDGIWGSDPDHHS